MECPGDARMRPMVARGNIEGRVLVIQIQSRVAAAAVVVVRSTLEGMRVVEKAEGEKCRRISKVRCLHIVTAERVIKQVRPSPRMSFESESSDLMIGSIRGVSSFFSPSPKHAHSSLSLP
jgi:hypothetical protein